MEDAREAVLHCTLCLQLTPSGTSSRIAGPAGGERQAGRHPQCRRAGRPRHGAHPLHLKMLRPIGMRRSRHSAVSGGSACGSPGNLGGCYNPGSAGGVRRRRRSQPRRWVGCGRGESREQGSRVPVGSGYPLMQQSMQLAVRPKGSDSATRLLQWSGRHAGGRIGMPDSGSSAGDPPSVLMHPADLQHDAKTAAAQTGSQRRSRLITPSSSRQMLSRSVARMCTESTPRPTGCSYFRHPTVPARLPQTHWRKGA